MSSRRSSTRSAAARPRRGSSSSRRSSGPADVPLHVWMAGGVLVAVPLALDPGGYFMFLPLKWTLATALVAAGLAALVLDGRPLARSGPVIAWLVLLAVLVAASLAGVGGLTSWVGYPGRYLGVIAWATFGGAFVVGASTTALRDRLRLAHAASAASILVSGYALLQAVGVDPISWSSGVDVSRTRSTLGNAAFLGGYLVLVVPLATRLALVVGERPRGRLLHAAAAVAGTAALLTTQTRGAWLGALAGLVLVVVLEHRHVRAVPRRALATAGAVALVLVLLATVSPYASRIRSVADPGTATGRGRITQWDRSLHLIAARPVLGWGPETFAFTFPRYVDAHFERTVGRDAVPDRAHNVVLDVAAASGVVGVAAYLAVLVLLAFRVGRLRERDPVTVGLAGSCAAYLGQLQFSFPIPDVDTVFWLLAGLMLAGTAPRAFRVRRAWAVVPLVAAVGFGAWGATEVVADNRLRGALDAEAAGNLSAAQRLAHQAMTLGVGRAQYAEAAGRLNERVGEVTGRPADFARGLADLDRARRLVPRDLELALDEADLLLSWGQATGDHGLVGRAASRYEAILRLDRNSSRVHLKVGVAYVLLGRDADAEREWLSAAALAPRSPSPLVNLGRLYEQEGRTADARRVLTLALRVDPTSADARQLLAKLTP